MERYIKLEDTNEEQVEKVVEFLDDNKIQHKEFKSSYEALCWDEAAENLYRQCNDHMSGEQVTNFVNNHQSNLYNEFLKESIVDDSLSEEITDNYLMTVLDTLSEEQNIIASCPECGTTIYNDDQIPKRQGMYECCKCGYPVFIK